jgi:hypothetical protein
MDPMEVKTRRPLLGKFDLDPGAWRNYKYEGTVNVPVTANGAAETTIKILNQPFIMEKITHSIIGATWDPFGTGLAQDGQYFIEWKEEQSEYQSGPLLARSAYGMEPHWIPLSAPLVFSGNRVLTFRVTNTYTRILTPEVDTFPVQLIVHGISNWGTDRRP